jgi:Putative prokaryotic signal transducing protein/zinc-ribbon domain
MAYCPKCGTEYEEGTRECMDCHASLRSGAPPAKSVQDVPRDVKLVQVRVFSGGSAFGQAELAKSWLESEGIPCALPGEASAGVLPVLDVQLLVREEDAEQAREILKEYLESSTTFPQENEPQ